VTAVPVDLGADRYVICTLTDISAQKRRCVLERFFFHDVLNTAVGVRGLADLLLEAEGEQVAEVRGMLVNTAATLVEQIQSQRLLTVAGEQGSARLRSTDRFPGCSAGHPGALAGTSAGASPEPGRQHGLPVGPVFVGRNGSWRLLLNSMVKNAFEASSRGMEIALGCYAEEQAVVFGSGTAA